MEKQFDVYYTWMAEKVFMDRCADLWCTYDPEDTCTYFSRFPFSDLTPTAVFRIKYKC